MRLIAQTTLFNRGDFERLRSYITDNYAESALETAPVKARLAEFKALYRIAGKMRIERVVAVDKHTALVILEAERGAFFMAHMAVTEDYPHKVLLYVQRALEAAEFDSETII
jgi:hypothetical protein